MTSSLLTASVLKGAPAHGHDIEYARAGELSLRMDYRVPEGRGPFPAVILVHGGGWISGDRKNNVEPLFEPLEQAGFAWFSISYRLAGQMSVFGEAIDDVKQAVKHVQAQAEGYRIDPNRIVLLGESAGGQLASMAALSPDLKGAVRGVVAFYSPSDLVSLAKTSPHVPAEMRNAVNGTPFGALLMAGLQRLSPTANIRPGMPPFLLIHGSSDPLVPFSQSSEFCAKARAAGANCEVLEIKGAGHGLRWWRDTKYQAELIHWLHERFRA